MLGLALGQGLELGFGLGLGLWLGLNSPCGRVVVVVVSVEAKLSFVEPGCRRAHSPSSSGAPGIPYQGTMKTSMRMLRT